DEVALTAAWALGSAETRIGQTVAALQDLVARGVDSCKPGHVEAMRQAVIRTAPIKQILLIGGSGDAMCTDTGAAAARQQVVASAAVAKLDFTLEAVRLSDGGDRFLRVRRAGTPGVTALVPVSLLLPQASAHGGRLLGYARIALADGTALGDS